MRAAANAQPRDNQNVTPSQLEKKLAIVWLRKLWRAWRVEPRNEWLLGPLVAVVILLWPLGPSASFFSNWLGVTFWLSLGWALAAARMRPTVLQKDAT